MLNPTEYEAEVANLEASLRAAVQDAPKVAADLGRGKVLYETVWDPSIYALSIMERYDLLRRLRQTGVKVYDAGSRIKLAYFYAIPAAQGA